MASELRVNTSTNRVGLGTITYTDTGPIISGITTGNNFKTGTTNVHSTGVELVNINTAGATATFGGDISIPDTIVHTGDTDTKLDFGTNTINLTAGGTTGLTVLDASVRVPTKLGINGAAPQTPLDVIANGSGYAISVRGRSADNIGEIRFTSNNYGSLYSVLQTGATYLNFQVGSTTNALRITSDGNILAGRNSDYWSSRAVFQEDKQGRTAILVKNDTNHANASSSIMLNAYGNSWTMNCGSTARDSNSFTINQDATSNSNQGTERLRINTSGYVGVKRSGPLANLHTTNNELAIGANPTSAAAPNATYDGLVVDGEAGSFINIRSRGDGNASYGRLAFSDNERSRGYVEYRHKDGSGDDWLGFATSSSEKVRINSSGQLLINTTTSPAFSSRKLTISDVTSGATTAMEIRSATNGTGRIYFTDSTSSSDAGSYAAKVYYDHNTDHMAFYTGGGTSTPAERFRIDGNGKVIVASGQLHSSRVLARFGIDCHGMDIYDGVGVVANYGMAFYNDPTTNKANGIGFFNDDGQTCGGYIVHQDKGGSNIGDLIFATAATANTPVENFRIASDGKLYKSGNHFYPLVNYVEVSSFTGASVSSNSYTDLRTIYSGYSPKKAGNLIVIHHQSQCWQGGQANDSGDAFWKIQRQEGGGSWTDTIENGRIMGNMDGRNYTGNSGLARHHRTVHLMGSFTSNGNNFNLKTQGKVDFTSVGLQWYHHSNNILQIWEYEKG